MHIHRFAERLRELRRERGLLQRDLEQALSLRPGALSQYECGRREPGFDLLLSLADYLNISVDYLLGRPDAFKDSPAVLKGRLVLREHLERPGFRPPARAAERLAFLLQLMEAEAPHAFAPARLARYLGVPESALERYSRAEVKPPAKLMAKLSAYVDLPQGWLSERQHTS